MFQVLRKGNPFLTAWKGENCNPRIKDLVNHLSFKYQILYLIPKFDSQHFVLFALNVSMATLGSYSGIPIFRTSKGNENWLKKISVWDISGKITVFDWGEGTIFGSSYQEIQKIEGSRNRDSTVLVIKMCCNRYYFLAKYNTKRCK